MAVRKPKVNELSSREDFVIEQYASVKKLNKMAGKLFDLYYIDVDRNSELSPMMRSMVPTYYVDPNNPEHPGAYILAGKSVTSYLERMMFVIPFVDSKNKYAMDLSGWKGLLMSPAEFILKTKDFRKTRLEPMVIMGDRYGERFNQSLILRESATPAKQELVLPFLQLPNRKMAGEDLYQQALQELIYKPFYQYLPGYIRQPIQYTSLSPLLVEELLDSDVCDLEMEDGDIVTVTKSLFPTLAREDRLAIGRVPNPNIDTSGGRMHYIVRQEALNEFGADYIVTYTLLAALQMRRFDEENG